LQFIDALRAYAILMMLQGHFVDMMLARAFRDKAEPLYAAWSFMRGMTAPIFFTITGIVFVFLLLRRGQPLAQNPRVGRGLRRGLQLIGIGYLIQLSLPALLSLTWYDSFWEVDVLHCIGLALIALIGLYALSERTRLSLPWLLGGVGLLLFCLEPAAKATDWSSLPRFLEHYFTKDHGSNFTPIPWVGYTLIGGIIGWHISRDHALYRTGWWPLFFLISGWMLHQYSSLGLLELHEYTGWLVFKQMAYNNYLLFRLGHVFIVVAIFIWLEVLFKRFHPLLLKIGSETLTIYAVHFVLLYGTWLGLGIATFLKYSLSPWAVALGAAAFVAFFIGLIARIEQVRAWVQRHLQVPVGRAYRRARVVVFRSSRRGLRQFLYSVERGLSQLSAWLLPRFLRR